MWVVGDCVSLARPFSRVGAGGERGGEGGEGGGKVEFWVDRSLLGALLMGEATPTLGVTGDGRNFAS